MVSLRVLVFVFLMTRPPPRSTQRRSSAASDVYKRQLQYTGTRAKVRAEVLLADGSVAAEAEALLLRPPAELFASWEAEKPYWKVYDD